MPKSTDIEMSVRSAEKDGTLNKSVSWSESEDSSKRRLLSRQKPVTRDNDDSDEGEEDDDKISAAATNDYYSSGSDDESDSLGAPVDRKEIEKKLSHQGSAKEGPVGGGGVPGRNPLRRRMSRYDDQISKDDDHTQTRLKDHERKKSQKKAHSSLVAANREDSSNNKKPSMEESFDFFTKVDWEPVSSELSQENPSNDQDLITEENETKLHSHDILLDSGYEWTITEPATSEIIEPQLRRENIFVPSSRPVNLEDKLDPGKLPRFLEEEGLFVGESPAVPQSLKNKMEQR